METINKHIGIDVSKTYLDIQIGSDISMRIKNERDSILNFVKEQSLGRESHVVMESTGGYQTEAFRLLHDAGVRVSVVMPTKIKHFAKSIGAKAKTDKLDAKIIQEYCAKLNPEATVPMSAERGELVSIHKRRLQLVEMVTMEKNRAKSAGYTHRESIVRTIKLLKAEIKAVSQELEGKKVLDAEIAEKSAILESAPGVGKVTANALCLLLPEIGTISGKKIAALVGLAPYDNSSGKKVGKRSIFGGRKEVRCAMYMATMSAIIHNKKIRKMYLRLRKAGKPKMVALTACMRKFLVCLNASVKAKKTWNDTIKKNQSKKTVPAPSANPESSAILPESCEAYRCSAEKQQRREYQDAIDHIDTTQGGIA
jgi:transposase